MKFLQIIFCFFSLLIFGQNIQSIQLFNPKTNDETPVIGFNDQLILRFDDLSNSSQTYRYTYKHFDRNWQADNLFFTEFATGSLNAIIDQFQYSFNTSQAYTNYTLTFPNDQIKPKVSGNFEIIVYRDSPSKPLFTKRFCVVEDGASLGLNITRLQDSKNPELNQRVQVEAVSTGANLLGNLNSISLNVIQNNDWDNGIFDLKPSSTMGNEILFQQLSLAFAGNNEFYYFDDKMINQPFDMVENVDNIAGKNYTYLFPVLAYPLNYQNQGDVNGAFYFRRNDLGIERNANREADYSWVYFNLNSDKIDKQIYVLGQFNDYVADKKSEMFYDAEKKMYTAKIYLKQGFYNYILATKDAAGKLNFGEINGNFWQTENLYQAFLYYTPFGRNYDALVAYGEDRRPVR